MTTPNGAAATLEDLAMDTSAQVSPEKGELRMEKGRTDKKVTGNPLLQNAQGNGHYALMSHITTLYN